MYFQRNCHSADSILDFYNKNKNGLPLTFLADARFNLYISNEFEEADKILDFLNLQRINGGFSEEDEAYFNYNQGLYWLYQDTQRARQFLSKIPETIVTKSDTFSLAYFNVLGQYYFSVNKLELALESMQKAFSAAVELGDTLSIGRMATNLGGINSILGFDKAAAEYLLRAQSYDPNNIILANNLASVLIGQKQYSKAKEILDRFRRVLSQSDSDPENMIYRLTYVHLLQEMHLWDDSRKYLENIKIENLPSVQFYNLHSFKLLQLENDKSDKLFSYMDNILATNGSYGYSELFYYLSGWSTRFSMKPIREHFIQNLSDLDTSEFDLMSLSVYHDLKAELYNRSGDQLKAAQMKSKSLEFLKNHYAKKLESKETDLLNRLELFDLERRYAKTKQQSETISLRLRINNLIMLFTVVLLVTITVVYIRQGKLKRDNEKLAKDLVVQKEAELQILERERDTSKKLVEMSSRILETSKDLKMKLISIPEKNLPGIRESLDDLDYILFLNKSVDTRVISKGFDFTKLDFLNELIESQKQVLSLSLDSYKPKEIAVTLNLSYSYVRNVQSKLRRILKDEGYETFEDLKIALEA